MRQQNGFDELLNRYRGMLYTLGRRFSRRGLEVDDLLQEASVTLWMHNERLLAMPVGPGQAALVWKMARNAMIDALRGTPDTEALPQGLETTLETESHTAIDELHEQIALLDEPDRTLVRMQLEGYSYEEIARHTGLTVSNVSVRLVRTREKLRQQFI